MPGVSLTDDIRAACAAVAAGARQVRIREEAVEAYAAALPAQSPPAPDLAPGESDERRAAFQITLNSINFGSGWFPTLRKKPGMSGFRTVEAGLRARGPWTAEELAGWPTWHDVSPYGDRRVPFFKRAQIAAADLALAGLAPGDDLGALTLFADNLVPHVLRLDGVLEFDDDLVARIDAEQLIEHDAPEEVEIRACALHAVQLLVAAHPEPTTATAVDNHLWHRGGGPRYKARPRHRARTTAY